MSEHEPKIVSPVIADELRDWFAGQALQVGINFSHAPGEPLDERAVSRVAFHAYALADAMLKERER